MKHLLAKVKSVRSHAVGCQTSQEFPGQVDRGTPVRVLDKGET